MSAATSQTINLQDILSKKKQVQAQKQRMMPLVRFLKKHGLKFKNAVSMGIRIEYFRIDGLKQVIQKNQELINNDSRLKPLFDEVYDQLSYFKRVENSQKLRYPQNLTPTQKETGKFASFKFQTSQSKKIYFIIVLSLIIIGVLFPLWPYELKYGLWQISVVLLVVIVSVILLRIILYVVLASLGISFWLLPNLMGDYGVLDSLKPLYSIERWERNAYSIALRVGSFVLFAYYCHSIYTQPEFYLQNFESAKEVVQDVHDWGVNKIKGEAGNFSQRALTMDKILNETADAFQQGQTSEQYTSFEVPDLDLNTDDGPIPESDLKNEKSEL